MNILTVKDVELWDERRWQQGLKGQDPEEFFDKVQKSLEMRMSNSAPSVDDLPPEAQDWYRSTGDGGST